jgi:hypothetical protein
MRAPRDFLDGAQMEEIVADLLFRESVGRGMIELGQLRDGPHVGFDRAVGVAAQLEIESCGGGGVSCESYDPLGK